MVYHCLVRQRLQSTSDQQEYLRYPPIAAAAPAAIAGPWRNRVPTS